MSISLQEKGSQTVAQHIQAITREKPGLEELITAFGKVQAVIDNCRLSLPQPDVSAVTLDTGRFREGVPVLEQAAGYAIEFHLEKTAPDILPVLAETFGPLAQPLQALEKSIQDPDTLTLLNDFLSQGDEVLLDRAADRFDMDRTILAYVLECLGRPALENLAAALLPLFSDVPWNFWGKGYCPVCGSNPSMSLLRLGQQEPTEFLKNSSAQRWLCCSACAHTWRFSRTRCPQCGTETQSDREYFYVEEKNNERVELCPNCHHYLLTMDIRERVSPLDHRLAPLGLAHLDILAGQKGYSPLVQRPWNLVES